MKNIIVEELHGQQITNVADQLAALRMPTFQQYPYYHVSDLPHEQEYFAEFAQNPAAVVAVAYEGEKLIGFSTGIPLLSDTPLFKAIADKFKQAFGIVGLDASEFYYYGDVILIPEYRGKGIASLLYQVREKQAKNHGFNNMCFLTVENYKVLAPMWQHLGFQKTNITINFSWPTLQVDGTTKTLEHELIFWIK